jgi:crossover junction endodeoxyribonuclease RusA
MSDPLMTVEIVPPAARMSMNDRHHWRTRHRLTRAWRSAGWAAALEQLGRGPAQRRRPPCMVRVEFPVRDPRRRRDPHNTAPTVKAIIDGLVDAGVWPDDNDQWVIVLDPRFYRPDGAFALAPVVVHLIPRADQEQQ